MKKKGLSLFIPVSLILILLFMLICPLAALEGAKTALLVWFQTLLPSLLPFMIISSLLVSTGSAVFCTALIHPLFRHLFKTSREGTFALVTGFLCGFPMGAKILGDFLKEKKITISEGDFLLCFCNNFSPMFVLSFLCPLLSIPKWKIIAIVFGSPLLYGLLTARLCKKNRTISFDTPVKNRLFFSFSMADSAIMNGFSAITKLGGYMILFGIFAKMATALPAATIFKSILISLTEVTNGISYATQALYPEKIKAAILLPALCFGGLSGFAQTKSILNGTTLSLRKYMKAKFLTALLCLFLTVLLC